MMTREEIFTELIRQGLSERQANYVADKKTYHVTPKRGKVVVDFKPEFITNNDRLKDFSEKFAPKNFKKSYPYYNTFNGWRKLGFKVKNGEKSGAKCELLFKVGRKWDLKNVAVFSAKQVKPLAETSETVRKNSKKATRRVADSDLAMQAVRTDFIPVDTTKAEEKPYTLGKKRNKNTKHETVTEKFGDVTARVENSMLIFDDPAITF